MSITIAVLAVLADDNDAAAVDGSSFVFFAFGSSAVSVEDEAEDEEEEAAGEEEDVEGADAAAPALDADAATRRRSGTGSTPKHHAA